MNIALRLGGSAAVLLAAPAIALANPASFSHSGNFCSSAPVENALSGGENAINGFGNQAVGVNMGAGQWMSDLTDSGPGNTPSNSQGFNYPATSSSAGAGGLARPGAFGSNVYAWNGAGLDTNYSIAWSGNQQDTHDERTGFPPSTRHGELMAGYLYSIRVLPDLDPVITLASTGIADLLTASGADEYSVTLYIDGEDFAATPEIGTWTAELLSGGTAITYYGQDTSDFLKTDQTISNFVRVTSTTAGIYGVGNYVTFSGLTGDFSIELTGVSHGVVLNGFDVAFAPTPGTLALLGLGLMLPVALRRRRQRAA
jgi:hypothetical protein